MGPSPAGGVMRAMKSFGSPFSGCAMTTSTATGGERREARVGGIGMDRVRAAMSARVSMTGPAVRSVGDRPRHAEHESRPWRALAAVGTAAASTSGAPKRDRPEVSTRTTLSPFGS